MNENIIYLGDGVYGRFDGFGVWLTTENGFEIANEIYLEPQVYDNLTAWIKRLGRKDENNET